MTRLQLTITYTNGRELTQLVHYARVEQGTLTFAVDSPAHPIFEKPAQVPMTNIQAVEITTVECNGWEVRK